MTFKVNDLLEHLRKNRGNGELTNDSEELRVDIFALLTSAVHDQNPSYTLSDISCAIMQLDAASVLDALNIIPLLIHSKDPSADEILSVLGECGSGKETALAIQESLECLLNDLNSGNEGDDTFQVIERLLLLYTAAIQRLQLRRRPASKTVQPIFENISLILGHATSSFSTDEARTILQLVCRTITSTISWFSAQIQADDAKDVNVLCRNLLYSSLSDLFPYVKLHLAQMKFESAFPRLVFGENRSISHFDESALQECLNVADELKCSVEELMKERVTGALILLSILVSHGREPLLSANSTLSTVLPTLLASLQIPAGVDPGLCVVLYILFPTNNTTSSPSIDPEIIAPLMYAVASIACMNEDPQIRHISFRILGVFLSRAPPLEHMHLLRELLTESPFPAMQISAVGLLKDAVLEALNVSDDSGKTSNPFASPALLQTFGYTVMRPNPPDILSKTLTPSGWKDFLESNEPSRLVECLAFYYVVLLRDVRNLTGIRDSSQMRSTDKELLSPLRNALQVWITFDDATRDEQAQISLAALGTSLQRIDDAYARLKS